MTAASSRVRVGARRRSAALPLVPLVRLVRLVQPVIHGMANITGWILLVVLLAGAGIAPAASSASANAATASFIDIDGAPSPLRLDTRLRIL